MELDVLEAAIYAKLAEIMGSEGAPRAFEYPGEFKVGYFFVGDEDAPIHMVFTIPKTLEDCYVSFSDGDPELIAEGMASLQQYNDEISRLNDGDTAPITSDCLNTAGWVAFFITEPEKAFDGLPNTLELAGRNLKLRLAVPLNEAEYSIKIEEGIAGLFKFIEKEQRDLVAFNWNTRR